jgi:hypothetical protein
MENEDDKIMKRLFDNPYEVREHPVVKEMIKAGDIAKGEQRTYKFPNGYGASVVKFGWQFRTSKKFMWMHYGDETHWELAVTNYDDGVQTLCYDTPITDDVIGHLTEEEVENILHRIKGLPKIK